MLLPAGARSLSRRQHAQRWLAVRQAVWCQFSCQLSSKFSLCALQSELITIFEGDGPMHTVPLPFRASRLWPACDGIIVEKQSGADDGEEHLLFSLLHGYLL